MPVSFCFFNQNQIMSQQPLILKESPEHVLQEAIRECAQDYCRAAGKDPNCLKAQYMYTDITPFQKLGRDIAAKLKSKGYSLQSDKVCSKN